MFDWLTRLFKKEKKGDDMGQTAVKIGQLQDQVKKCNIRVDALIAEKNTLTNQILTLNSQIAAKDAEIATLKASGDAAKITELQNQVNTLTTQVNTLNTQATALNSQINTLKNQIAAKDAEIVTLKANALDAADISDLNGVDAFIAANQPK